MLQQGKDSRFVPAALSSVHEKSARMMQLVMADVPSMKKQRKWRRECDRTARPSAHARVCAQQYEMAAAGVAKNRAQLAVDDHQRAHDDAYAATSGRLTAEDFRAEVEAEGAENALTLLVAMRHESPNTIRAWVDAMKLEVAAQNVLIRKGEAMLAEAESAR